MTRTARDVIAVRDSYGIITLTVLDSSGDDILLIDNRKKERSRLVYSTDAYLSALKALYRAGYSVRHWVCDDVVLYEIHWINVEKLTYDKYIPCQHYIETSVLIENGINPYIGAHS